MASFVYNGETIELKTKTLNIAKKQDLMMNAITLEEEYRRQYEFALEVLGYDTFKSIFGTDNINDIDLSELTFVCNEIDDAYMEKIYEQQRNKSERIASNKAVEKLIQAGNSVKSLEKYKNKK